MIINASRIEQITSLARKHGFACEEKYELGNVRDPVILSDHELSDPTGEIANTLVSTGVQVLYVAYEPPVHLSPSVMILSGEKVTWMEIENWIQQAQGSTQKTRAVTLEVKRTIAFYGIIPGVGAGSVARGLAFYSAMRGVKTLYIDLDYRFPKSPYIIGYKHAQNTLENLLQTLLNKETPVMESYFLHKSNQVNLTKQQAAHIEALPDELYVLSPSPDLGMEYFPGVGTDMEEATHLIKTILEGAKPYFQNIIVSMGSDPDDMVNLAALRACDQRIFVIDTSPCALRLYQQRMPLLHNSGVQMENTEILVNKVPDEVTLPSLEEFLRHSLPLSIDYDPNMVKELNNLNSLGGSSFRKGIEKVAVPLLGLKPAEKGKDSILTRWFSKNERQGKSAVVGTYAVPGGVQ
ncbi:hypothetical protein LOK74_01985 [Brevibacillus humidisoli]|uniref:AAA family ATPase n=1 Tax=Brevibacillus humidisoli TaxID=2895522 RepID=UPI001E3801F0|nr:hypothetical protein [Brevibacillus humidisoli]UFJ41330.1 hypothetical protein LOK74_01985 [Brevibacillus humidisoli]